MVIGQGTGQSVGGEHREHDREAEWGEQVFCRPFEKNNRSKHAADRQCRYQRRHGDAGGAMQGRLRQRLAFFGQQAVGVFDRHCRIIDEDADGER
jgi:hypothetical protein